MSSCELDQPQQFIASFNRPNLSYGVLPKGKDSFDTLADLFQKHKGESAIIYCTSRSDTESLAARLRKDGFDAQPYHAGLDSGVRRATQERFIRDELSIVVATIAFGMGIDKPNVRLLVHYDLPKSLEGYYQETGRAGRDGLPSRCVLFYTYADAAKQEFFINQIEDEAEQANARDKLTQVVEFCQIQECRRKYILGYFGETWHEDNCGGCDFCLTPRDEFDATVIAQKILSAVIRTDERFGINHVSAVLRGGNTKGIRQWEHNNLSVYGIAKDVSTAEIKEIFGLLVAEGFLYRNSGDFPTFGVTETGRSFLRNRETLTLSRPKRAEERSSTTRRATLDYDQALFDELREMRRQLASERKVPPYIIFGDTTLQEMAYYIPQSRESLSRITGVGKVKIEQLGEAFLSVICGYASSNNLEERAKPGRGVDELRRVKDEIAAGSTFDQTKKLLRQGLTIEEVAQRRGLAHRTISEHLERLVRSGEEIDLRPLMPLPERFEKIRAAFEETGGSFLAPVKEILRDDFSYDEIRLVKIYLDQQAGMALRPVDKT